MSSINVKVGNVDLKRPLILASGTCNFGHELSEYYDLSILGGLSSKGLTIRPRQGNEGCRVAETASGMLNSVALEKYPELFFNTLRMDECYPNGESPIDFFNRIKITFDKLLKDELNNNVAIVTHSGVINIIYHIVKNIEWSNKNKTFPIKNVSLHTLEYKDGKVEFLEENKMVI